MEAKSEEVAIAYRRYLEEYPQDSETIQACYGRVESLVDALPHEIVDAVCEEVGTLCAEHERRGFAAGFCAAMEQV